MPEEAGPWVLGQPVGERKKTSTFPERPGERPQQETQHRLPRVEAGPGLHRTHQGPGGFPSHIGFLCSVLHCSRHTIVCWQWGKERGREGLWVQGSPEWGDLAYSWIIRAGFLQRGPGTALK